MIRRRLLSLVPCLAAGLALPLMACSAVFGVDFDAKARAGSDAGEAPGETPPGASGGGDEGSVPVVVAPGPGADGGPREPAPRRIGAGYRYACGLRADATIACWGALKFTSIPDPSSNYDLTPPAGTFRQISTGYLHACGVRTDKTAVCWGSNLYGKHLAPVGNFLQISAGQDHSCGVREDGTVTCWGRNASGESTAPSGTFSSVSAGTRVSCGVRTNGSLRCWGDDDEKQATPPTQGLYASVIAGQFPYEGTGAFACALGVTGSLVCWGKNVTNRTVAPAGTFADFALGPDYGVALDAAGNPTYWGNVSTLPITDAVPGVYRQVAASGTTICAIAANGTAGCWGYENTNTKAPDGSFW